MIIRSDPCWHFPAAARAEEHHTAFEKIRDANLEPIVNRILMMSTLIMLKGLEQNMRSPLQASMSS